ncbi:hypothetical protein KAS08_02480 [Candidatus Pacearchaeota archaeon]|nr:hypothetical protein [Candidatus Pacearchaeota archaeon]
MVWGAIGTIALKVGSSILAVAKTGLGKTILYTAASVPVTSAISNSLSNITTPLGINKDANAKNEIALNESKHKILESSKKANVGAINAVTEQTEYGERNIKDIIIIGGLLVVALTGFYFVAKR